MNKGENKLTKPELSKLGAMSNAAAYFEELTLGLKYKTMCIEKVLFDLPGKITLKMEDGRMIISPLKYFPDLQKLSVDKRKKHTIVDERTILFTYSDAVYHLEDFIGLEANWRKR